jgi:hypothetical protein
VAAGSWLVSATTAARSADETIPQCHLRYGSSAHFFGFAV